jgi:hypothetical protein
MRKSLAELATPRSPFMFDDGFIAFFMTVVRR